MTSERIFSRSAIEALSWMTVFQKHSAAVMIVLEVAFRHLETQVPKPVEVLVNDQPALRYVEQTVEQALLQKLARFLSGLNAIQLLLHHGFVQEQAVIQRTLDEIGEDIMFLAFSLPKPNKLQRNYLKRFWQEEFEEGVDVIDSEKPRYQICRKDISNYLIRAGVTTVPKPERVVSVIRQAYSGYVHAASPHIMEMCGGDDFQFFIAGLRGTHRIVEHGQDAWNYLYRGFVSTITVAKAFGDEPLMKALYRQLAAFEQASGTSIMSEVQESRTKKSQNQ